MKHYNAPWSTSLIVMSCLGTLVCLGAAVSIVSKTQPLLALLPVAVIVGSALFTIRGYVVTSDAILIERLFWATRLPLAGIRSAEVKPRAMRCSLRLFGNGGMFSVSGLFRNRALGNYRAFVTDQTCTVILTYGHRTVVVSPGAPADFVRDLPVSRTSSP